MTRFKNNDFERNGFTLIEAMLAVTIMGLVLSPMFLLETNVFNAVMRWAEQFQRLIIAKNFVYAAQREEPPEGGAYSVEKREENPATYVRYQLKAIPRASSLFGLKNLYWQEVDASSMRPDGTHARIVRFVYKSHVESP